MERCLGGERERTNNSIMGKLACLSIDQEADLWRLGFVKLPCSRNRDERKENKIHHVSPETLLRFKGWTEEM